MRVGGIWVSEPSVWVDVQPRSVGSARKQRFRSEALATAPPLVTLRRQ